MRWLQKKTLREQGQKNMFKWKAEVKQKRKRQTEGGSDTSAKQA